MPLVRVRGIREYMLARYGADSPEFIECAFPSDAGASPTRLVVAPAARGVASSPRTSARRSRPIATPVGLTSRFLDFS